MTTPFVALMTSLPTGNSTIRMRVWRALKSTGCGVLRDGVYVLPWDAPQAPALSAAGVEVNAAGGFAMTVGLTVEGASELERVRALFDRGQEYGALVERIGAARAAIQRLGRRKADTLVQRLRRAFQEVVEMDFYPGPAHLQVKEALSALEAEMQRVFSGGEPRSAKGKVRRLDPGKYRNRTWATRKNLWVDRVASAWLIRRFIDTGANFAWIDRPRDAPRGSVGFDFDGAQFTHVEGRVTFETLLASFGLENDAALVAIGRAVHFLDIGGIPVADASGLETMLKGIKGKTRDDDEMLREAGKVFDFFHSAYNQPAEKNAE